MNGRLWAVLVLPAAVVAGAGATKPTLGKDRLREPMPRVGEQKNPGITPRNLFADDPAAAPPADSVSSTFSTFCAPIGGVPVEAALGRVERPR